MQVNPRIIATPHRSYKRGNHSVHMARVLLLLTEVLGFVFSRDRAC